MASIGGNDETDIAGSQSVTTGKDLIEKIGQIRKSVAAVQQQIISPVVWIGSGTIKVAQLMLDTLDVVKELAEQTATIRTAIQEHQPTREPSGTPERKRKRLTENTPQLLASKPTQNIT